MTVTVSLHWPECIVLNVIEVTKKDNDNKDINNYKALTN